MVTRVNEKQCKTEQAPPEKLFIFTTIEEQLVIKSASLLTHLLKG